MLQGDRNKIKYGISKKGLVLLETIYLKPLPLMRTKDNKNIK